MSTERRCAECDGPLVCRGYAHVTKVGKVTVTDGTRAVPTCKACGEPALTLQDLESYERRAASTALREGRHVDGDVLRFARKAAGLRQADLAKLLEYTAETVSRWESGAAPVARAAQLAIASLLEGAELYGHDLRELARAPESTDGTPDVTELDVPRVERAA